MDNSIAQTLNAELINRMNGNNNLDKIGFVVYHIYNTSGTGTYDAVIGYNSTEDTFTWSEVMRLSNFDSFTFLVLDKETALNLIKFKISNGEAVEGEFFIAEVTYRLSYFGYVECNPEVLEYEKLVSGLNLMQKTVLLNLLKKSLETPNERVL